MFTKQTYIKRRKKLHRSLESGLVILLGHLDSPINFLANPYRFRQDSSFLYFFGLNGPKLAAVMDMDEGEDYIFGDDAQLDDIIWMGSKEPVAAQAMRAGVEKCLPYSHLEKFIKNALAEKRKIHILPFFRAETLLEIERLFDIHHSNLQQFVSPDLIKAVVKLRSIKDENEISQVKKAMETTYEMYSLAFKGAYPGKTENDIYSAMEAKAKSSGGTTAFAGIVTQNSHILHSQEHYEDLVEGRLLIVDNGVETSMGYASDITRTIPVGGRFNQSQKEIYNIVLKANQKVIHKAVPGTSYKSLHLMACKIICSGLIDIGLMKGDLEKAVSYGAHALFFPHGLGHLMGLDVHDMENFGEDFVGYDDEFKRSDQFGLNYLRFAKKLEMGQVLTVEPGCYFIPELIEKWRTENKFKEYINYDRIEAYKNFGGIRIEDNLLITQNGCENLSQKIPKTIEEIENFMAKTPY